MLSGLFATTKRLQPRHCVQLQDVRELLSARMPNSSFAEAHKNQPTWKMKMKIKRMKKKMRETVKSAKWRVEENQNNHCARSMDDVMRTNILSQCRVRHCYECMQMRENVTCEGFLFTPPCRLQQIAISCKRSDYNFFFFEKKTVKIPR